MFKDYLSVIDALPKPLQSVSGILYTCVLVVAQSSSTDDSSHNGGTYASDSIECPVPTDLITFGNENGISSLNIHHVDFTIR